MTFSRIVQQLRNKREGGQLDSRLAPSERQKNKCVQSSGGRVDEVRMQTEMKTLGSDGHCFHLGSPDLEAGSLFNGGLKKQE